MSSRFQAFKQIGAALYVNGRFVVENPSEAAEDGRGGIAFPPSGGHSVRANSYCVVYFAAI